MRISTLSAVLLIEDNRGDARPLREMFREYAESNRTELAHVENMRDAEAYLTLHAVDNIVLDLGLPDAHGLSAAA
ncbi:MAG: hypothetical protein RL701_7977 [Pseudomonadota bacterium]|jgi:DNA-binding response OmpR family regulator